MIAGFAKETITPSIGLPMAGYVGLRKSTGVLDDLHVRCIYLKQEEEVFLLQYDLLYVDKILTDQLCKRISSTFSMKENHVIINAIHTHSGPAQILDKSGINQRLAYIDGDYDEELVSFLLDKGMLAARRAFDDRKEAELSFGTGKYHDIGTNRNQKDKQIDDMLSVLELSQYQGTRALIFAYACHPTIFHEENTCYSCDLLASAFELLEQEVEVAMFYNGACGDVSTRFTKRSSSKEEAKRLGSLLADHVKEVQEHLCTVEETLHVLAATYTCKTRCYPEQMENFYNSCHDAHEEELLHLYEQMAKSLRNQTLELPVRVLMLGSLRYVYVPVELFSSLSLRLKQLWKDHEVILVAYAMDYFSYMPDEAAYEEQPIGFEAVISPFAKGCGERFIEAIADQIQ